MIEETGNHILAAHMVLSHFSLSYGARIEANSVDFFNRLTLKFIVGLSFIVVIGLFLLGLILLGIKVGNK